jgi:hypothetical protein
VAKQQRPSAEILVATAEDTRGAVSTRRLKVDELSNQIEQFVKLVDTMLSTIATLKSGFALSEVEISAEVTAKGSLALLGTGGEVGGSGGIKFLFKRGSGQ